MAENRQYNQELDKQLDIREIVVDEQKGTGIVVKLMQYDGGAKKIDLSRYYTDRDGNKRGTKAGRFFPQEIVGIGRAVRDMGLLEE